MTNRRWIIGAILATTIANPGCASLREKMKHWKSEDSTTMQGTHKSARGHVYVYMLHGPTPASENVLNELRVKLDESGVAKTDIGEPGEAGWVKREINAVRSAEPNAKFVLLGYEHGGSLAVSLARHLTTTGVPIEAVVLLDPKETVSETGGIPTHLITSKNVNSSGNHASQTVVKDATHSELPTHSTTVAVITDLLSDIAVKKPQSRVGAVQEHSITRTPDAKRTPTKVNSEVKPVEGKHEAKNNEVKTLDARPTANVKPTAKPKEVKIVDVKDMDENPISDDEKPMGTDVKKPTGNDVKKPSGNDTKKSNDVWNFLGEKGDPTRSTETKSGQSSNTPPATLPIVTKP